MAVDRSVTMAKSEEISGIMRLACSYLVYILRVNKIGEIFRYNNFFSFDNHILYVMKRYVPFF